MKPETACLSSSTKTRSPPPFCSPQPSSARPTSVRGRARFNAPFVPYLRSCAKPAKHTLRLAMALSRLASEREFLRLSTAHCSARRFVTPWARVVKSAPPGHFLNLRSSALYPQLYMVSGASAGSHPSSPRFRGSLFQERAFSSILLRRKMSRAPYDVGTDIDLARSRR